MSENNDIHDLLSEKEPERKEEHEIYRFQPYELEGQDIHELGVEFGAEVTGEIRGHDPEEDSLTYFMSFTY